MAKSDFDVLVEAMPKIAEAVGLFENEAMQERVLGAMLACLGVDSVKDEPDNGSSNSQDADDDQEPSGNGGTSKTRRRQGNSRRTSSEPSFDKELSGTPPGKESLKDFLARCNAKNQHEQVVAITYWLQEVVDVTPLGMDQVFTGFKLAGIKVPGAFAGKVSQVGSKGWLKETTKAKVSLSVSGSDHVEHEMLKRDGASTDG